MFESLTLTTRAECSMENPKLEMETSRASAMMSKRVLFLKEDGFIYQTKTMPSDALKQYLNEPKLQTLYQGKTVLNLLPFDQALNIYKGATA